MTIFFASTLLILGFIGLWIGGDRVVDGASEIATKFNIPEFVIGLTLVAFGTSAPELVVNAIAAYQHHPDIVFGNILGSNIANLLLILGISSIVTPLLFTDQHRKYLRYTLLTTGLLSVLLLSVYSTPTLTFYSGIILLSSFVFFMFKIKPKNSLNEDSNQNSKASGKSIIKFSFGLALLCIGGKAVVKSVILLSLSFGLSEAFISLFLVAFGTSLPELMTAISSIKKKNTDLLIGNILGSNIFNISLILGISTLITPLNFSVMLWIDIIIMSTATLLIPILLLIPKRNMLNLPKGLMLISSYLGYILFIFLRG